MARTQPEFLHPGDKIGIVAPARAINEKAIVHAESIFENWGLIPVKGKNLLGRFNQLSGTIAERVNDLQQMIDNPEIKAIMCAGGGYGAVQLPEHLQFGPLGEHPKWLIGFSDITVLHNTIGLLANNMSIHGPMPVTFLNDHASYKSLKMLQKTLFGAIPGYNLKHNMNNKPGVGTGEIIGGNLSILYSLIGTKYDLIFDNKILFIEEVDEYLYHIERMMYSMLLSGKLSKLKGLIVGQFSKLHDNEVPFGKSVTEIITEIVKPFNYPVIFDFPAGHEKLNLPLILGKESHISVNESETELNYM